MAELQNEFSWSKSRHEKFEECLRAYYYQYYGSWGGWEAPAGSAVRELYVLKKLSSRWQWAGSVVHDALKDMLRRARATRDFVPYDRVSARTRDRARAQFAVSREKSYWREASRIVGLVEHEYCEPVASHEWKTLYEDTIEASLRAFYGSETFDRIRRIPPERWLSVDELDAFELDGVKIWVAVDFAYRDADGLVHILDWKTGRERKVDHTQVAIYALYAQKKWGAALDGVVGGLVYLGTGAGERVSVRADREALLACEREVKESVARMRALLDDAGGNRACETRFPQSAERDRCRRCPFRRPCGRL